MSNKSIGVKVCEISVSCLGLFESKLKFDRNVFRSTKHLYRSQNEKKMDKLYMYAYQIF